MLRSVRGLLHLAIVLSAAFAAAQDSQPISADQIWNSLAAGNQRFAAGKPASQDVVAERKSLAQTQHPHTAVLSCSDSRVPPEVIFDAGLGEIFTVRSAGEDDDALVIGSLEYAVEHLGSTVIVVLGHQRCGAVTAACSRGKSESVNLDAVTDPIAPSCAKADASNSAALDLAVRDHVHRVAQDLLAKSKLLKEASDEHKLTIVEAYYSLDTGEVTKLR